ncbi:MULTISPECIES: helix-turn-helix transcriptional regulator [Streptomyces]|uniref:Uncharacterized protein n=1 Tax=Streptomyces harbinensis TaxID=1176198 RepID=A0A1I6WB72_9ACTN|nr:MULTISPECIES: hypothetical protein [Streptomyces]SFT23253.1 hypothetical protein SAMN05444716_1178 [Streptomyces harbinensis]
MTRIRPLANGIRTDHPVPGLPFVDDSHIPLDDGPEAIEAVGRNKAQGMWGRFDLERSTGGWRAFTTDPIRHSLAWAVRYHPDHGRTVLLVNNRNTSSLHSDWTGGPLLYRAGGYWWDGTTWYRPGQVWNPVSQDHERRKANAAVTVTAADTLDTRAQPANAHLEKIATFDPEAPAPDNWPDHLALWAHHHQRQALALPLNRCVVNLASPELSGDQLLGVPEMAQLAGISPSTLRGYISRNTADVPLPQATVGGRAQWSRPVAEDWVESRQRSADGIREAMSAGDRDKLSPGAAHIRDRFAEDFYGTLWGQPDTRKRWALRHRNPASVREVADLLAWSVAASLNHILPTGVLGSTIRHAVLDDFAYVMDLRDEDDLKKAAKEPYWWDLNLTPDVAKMLDWYIQHHPDSARWTIGDILREANARWGVPAHATGSALRNSLSMDGQMSKEDLNKYFELVIPRESTT